jgi:hypothetical protein
VALTLGVGTNIVQRIVPLTDVKVSLFDPGVINRDGWCRPIP